MNSVTATLPRLFAFPMGGIAYNDCLYAAAARKGLTVIDGVWAGRWLWSRIRAGDIMHIHWPSFLYYDPSSPFHKGFALARFFLLYFIIRARGGRIVWTAHNLYPHDGGKGEWSHRLVRRFIARNADMIIAHSSAAKTILQAEFAIPDDRIIEVPHGNWIGHHPHTVTKAGARATLGIAASAYVYCIVGTCRPYKNLEALIAAFKRIEGDCFLLIAGQFQSQDYKNRIDKLLADLRPSSFRLEARFVDNDEVQNYVVASDVLVLPYTEILTSGSVMLGLSFGVPVIAPRMGGLTDIVTDRCGLLYDAGAPEGLLHAMKQIRGQSYSPTGILEHARSFDWEIAAQTLFTLVKTLGSDKPLVAHSPTERRSHS